MSKIFFTSDTHFSSERTLKLSKRPFDSVKDMDEALITNWNSVVGKNDLVYHLGDFGDFNLAKYLNGKIILVPGNYEDKLAIYEYEPFVHAVLSPCKLNLKEYKLEVSVAHTPIESKQLAKKFGVFGLFGHIHKLQMVKRWGLNVGVDCHNFTPIDVETVLFYKLAIKKYYDENVFLD